MANLIHIGEIRYLDTMNGITTARIYNPSDVAYSALRIYTSKGIGAINLVSPEEADTNLRIYTPKGVKGIKSFLKEETEYYIEDEPVLWTSNQQVYLNTYYCYPAHFDTPVTTKTLKMGFYGASGDCLGLRYYLYLKRNNAWTKISNYYIDIAEYNKTYEVIYNNAIDITIQGAQFHPDYAGERYWTSGFYYIYNPVQKSYKVKI